MLLRDAAKLLNAKLLLDGKIVDDIDAIDAVAAFTSINIDTRQLTHGDLFIAIKGDNFDGHDFVAKAQEAGAVAAVVACESRDNSNDSGSGSNLHIPQLIVKDTIVALGQLGEWRRAQFTDGMVFAITGSCGKTTTRQLLGSILAEWAPTFTSIKSFNNNIGVPLTLWQIEPHHHRYVVLEVGANHVGEIAYLTKLIRPHVAIITNSAPTHLESFGSMQNIAQAKGEIMQGLQLRLQQSAQEEQGMHEVQKTQRVENGGCCIIFNADDEFYEYWRDLANSNNHKIITFGIKQPATVMATNIRLNNNCPTFTLTSPQGNIEINLPFLGVHNVANALAAAAAALSVGSGGVPLAVIKQGLEGACPVEQRLTIGEGYCGAKIIDDSYNAAPKAVVAALDILVRDERPIKIFVFADMLELGEESSKWHEYVGEAVCAASGINKVYTYGECAQVVAEMCRKICAENGIEKESFSFSSKEELIDALKPTLNQSTVVLIKGSRGMRMEEVVAALLAS